MNQKNAPKIEPISTTKDEIEQPELAKDDNMFIPPLGSSVIVSGKSGSGKSTLVANYLSRDLYYKNWFTHIFLFSPTANGDDIQKSLGIPKHHVFTDLKEAPALLEVILNKQQEKLDKAKSAADVAQYCIIFDDVIGDIQFMNSPEFTRCFYQVRHVNCTTIICTQHFKRVPRLCRLQANFIHFFEGSVSEVETVADEFAPGGMHKKNFMRLVTDATSEPYSFLTINMKVHSSIRFRRNLDDIIDLKKYGQDTKDIYVSDTQDVRSSAPEDDSSKLEEYEDKRISCTSSAVGRGVNKRYNQSTHRRARKR
jgi:hypothetical protein